MSQKGKALRVLGFCMAWVFFCLGLVPSAFMLHSGILDRGLNHTWNRYLDGKVYEDMKAVANSYCYDYIWSKNHDEYFSDTYYQKLYNTDVTNLRFSCQISDKDNSVLSGNYNPEEIKQYMKNYDFVVKVEEQNPVGYVFNSIQFRAFFKQQEKDDKFTVYKDGDNYYVEGFSDEENEYMVSIQAYIPEKFSTNDVYYYVYNFLRALDRLKYVVILFTVVSFVLVVFLTAILVSCAGKSEKGGEIKLRGADRIPLDLFSVISITCIVFLLRMTWKYFHLLLSRLLFIRMLTDVFVIVALVVIVGLIILGFAMTLSVRIQKHTWFKNNLLFILYTGILNFCVKFGRGIKEMKAFWRVGLLFIALDILAVAILSVLYANTEAYAKISLEFVSGLVLLLVMLGVEIVVLQNINMLETACNNIAEGNFEYRVDQKKLIGPFKKTGEAINHISDGMKLALKEQIKSEHFKTELITNVSHDIKTPLTSIITYVNLLQKTDVSGKDAEEYLDVLERQSDKLKKLIEDLVEASKAATGNLELELGNVDLGILCEQAMGEYEDRFSRCGLRPVYIHNDASYDVVADGRQLWRVLDNLLNNACKYAMKDTRFYLELDKKDDHTLMSFKNISKYELSGDSEELLERFVRGDKSRHTEGSGLGLSIAKSLIEAMGGSMKLETDGDLFKITAVLKNAENTTDSEKETLAEENG